MPRYNSNSINTQALPAARLNANAPIEAFGGGPSSERVFQASNQLMDTTQKIMLEEKKKADDIVTLDLNTRTTQLKHALFWDPKEGAMNRRGKDALAIEEEYTQRFDEKVQEFEKDLVNDDQRAMFQKIRDQHKAELTDTLRKHTLAEGRKFEEETFVYGIKALQEDAALSFDDPNKIADKIKKMRGLLTDQADRNGTAPEALEMKIKEEESKTHSLVLKKMLNEKQDVPANAYFKANQDRFLASDKESVSKLLEERNIRGQTQRHVDTIMAKATTKKEALELARSLPYGEVREEVEKGVEHRWRVDKEETESSRKDLFLQATNLVEANKGAPIRSVIPDEMYLQFTIKERKELQDYSNDVPRPIVLDDRNVEEIIKGTIAGDLSLDPKQKTERYNQFKLGVKSVLDDWQAAHKRPPTFNEKKAIIEEQYLNNEVFVDPSPFRKLGWTEGKRYPAAAVKRDEQKYAYVPIAKIPPQEIDLIKAALKKRGKPLSDERIQRAYYAKKVAKNDDLLRSILAE